MHTPLGLAIAGLGLLLPTPLTGQQPPSSVDVLTDAEQTALAGLDEANATVFELIDSWFEGRPIQYYHFGESAVRPSALYRVKGGGDVVSSLPGLPEYSALRQVYIVELDPAVPPHTVRSHEQIARLVHDRRARLLGPVGTINAPIVAHGSTLERDPEERMLRGAWYRGHRVAFFDFGANRIAAIDLVAFISGFDQSGEPLLLDDQPSNASAVPGLPSYSDLWAVTLAELGSSARRAGFRDLRRVRADAAAGRLTLHRRGTVVNCPVVYVDGRPAPR